MEVALVVFCVVFVNAYLLIVMSTSAPSTNNKYKKYKNRKHRELLRRERNHKYKEKEQRVRARTNPNGDCPGFPGR